MKVQMKRLLATFVMSVPMTQGAQSQDYLGSFLGAENLGRQLERSQHGRATTPPRHHHRTSNTKDAPAETGSISFNPYEGARVANFSVVDHGNAAPEFERLSFWSGPHGKIVDYVRGYGGKPIRLKPIGPNADGLSFAIRLPNGLILDVEPRGGGLLVRDRLGRYRNEFVWQYEGPVDGRGTFCTPCVGQKDAVAFVREHFLR
jgi:hypothetical protein